MSSKKSKTENYSDRTPMSQKEVEAAVRQKMLKQHIDVNETLNCNGELHYYHAEGDKRGTKKAWLVVHLGNNPRAHFGHFRNDNRGHWYANGAPNIPDDELKAIYRQLTKDRKRREKKERKAAGLALMQAKADWNRAKRNVSGHPYVIAKQVIPIRMRRLKGRLLAILYGIDGKPRGIQYINANGKKRYPTGQPILGAFFYVGDWPDDDSTLIICEGIATALTLHEVTGHTVVAALFAGNLRRVATSLRIEFPHADIIVAADNDHTKDVNTGLKAATKSGKLVEAKLAVPAFSTGEVGTDFNDAFRLHGRDVVVTAIQNAESLSTWPPVNQTKATRFDTQSANADRLVEIAGRDNLHCNHRWWYFGPVWTPTSSPIERAGLLLGKIVADEAAATMKAAATTSNANERSRLEDQAAGLNKFVKSAETASGISGSIKLAQSKLALPAGKFDQDPRLFPCVNGVIDLRTFNFRPHRRSDFMRVVGGCKYDPAAECPRWLRFLDQVFRLDRDLIEFVQHVLGYLLFGLRQERVLIVLFGKGSNGKTRFVDVLHDVFGQLAFTMQPKLLVRTKQDRHLTELMDLMGKRIGICVETSRDDNLYTDRVKALTGGDRITARWTHKDGQQFTPTHQLILQTNNLPKIPDTDYAIRSRLLVIPFNAKFEGQYDDKHLSQKLKAESAGILNWMLEGARKYKWFGLRDRPTAIVNATDNYVFAKNPAYRFFKACCKKSTNRTISSSKLYTAYVSWAQGKGVTPVTSNAFGRGLTQLGATSVHTSDDRGWKVRLKKQHKHGKKKGKRCNDTLF